MTSPVPSLNRLVLTRRVGERIVLRSIQGQHIATVEPSEVRSRGIRISIMARDDILVDREERLTEPEKRGHMRMLVIYDQARERVGTYDFDRCVFGHEPGLDPERATAALEPALAYVRENKLSFHCLGIRPTEDGGFETFEVDGVRYHRTERAPEPEPDPTPVAPEGTHGVVSTPDVFGSRGSQ